MRNMYDVTSFDLNIIHLAYFLFMLVNCELSSRSIYCPLFKAKAVLPHAMEALGGRRSIAPIHSFPRH
jgi:hypothetical protein